MNTRVNNMNNENNNPNNLSRTAIIAASVERTKPDMVQVTYLDATTNEQKTRYVPDVCIAESIGMGANTLLLLQDGTNENGHTIPAKLYGKSEPLDNPTRDIMDAWVEFGDLPTASAPNSDEDFSDLDLGDEDDADVNSDEDFSDLLLDEPSTDIDAEDYDDSVPQFAAQPADIVSLDVTSDDTEPSDDVPPQSAANKAAKTREERFGEEQKVAEEHNLDSDMTKALAAGKRAKDFGPWNFRTKMVTMVQEHVDPQTGEVTYHTPRDSKGSPRVRQVVNPTITDEENPFGVTLNRATGPNFAVVEHPDLIIPIMDAAEKLGAGVTCDAFSFNKGAKALVNIDLTDFSAGKRADAAASLASGLHLSANKVADILHEEGGGHRLGVSIMNNHDGKGALSAMMMVMRTYCRNLAMRGGMQALSLTDSGRTKVRHTHGAVSEFDPDAFAERLMDTMAAAQKHLIAMHVLRHIPIEMNLFDKMLTVFNKHGLLPAPKVKIDVGDSELFAKDDNGNIVLKQQNLTMDALKMTGGHFYRTVTSGWADPDLHYVALKNEDAKSRGTMFHLAQCLTGTLTHNPIWVSEDGKQQYYGAPQGVDTLIKRSSKATDLLESVAFAALDNYAKDSSGHDLNLDGMSDFFMDNPDQIIVPYSNSEKATKKKPASLLQVPGFTSTWKVGSIQAKV